MVDRILHESATAAAEVVPRPVCFSHVRLRFDPASGQRLVGTPTGLLNQPVAGSPLFADLPVPAPGQSVDLLLTVAVPADPAAAPGTKVRVKIRHSI